MSILGQILLWAGFLSGSLATVFGLEVAEDPWSTINWTWYGISVAVAIVGIVMLRMGKKAAAGQSDKSQANLKEIKASIANLVKEVGVFHKEIGDMSPEAIMKYIEDRLSDDLRTFADGRDSITAEHGLDVFAEVMTQFASGERSINRAWCAAADGYVDEAADCVERAAALFAIAEKQLVAAAK